MCVCVCVCVCVWFCSLVLKKKKGFEVLRFEFEVLPLMYLWWSLCTFYLHAHQVRVTVGDSGLCCCACVTSFKH